MHRNDVIDMIFRAYAEAESIKKDNYGRTPKEVSNDMTSMEGVYLLLTNNALIIADQTAGNLNPIGIILPRLLRYVEVTGQMKYTINKNLGVGDGAVR